MDNKISPERGERERMLLNHKARCVVADALRLWIDFHTLHGPPPHGDWNDIYYAEELLKSIDPGDVSG